MASTFTLPYFSPPVQITLPSDLDQDTLLSFPAFKTWTATLRKSLDSQSNPHHPMHATPYSLKTIHVQSADYFGGQRLGFVKLKAEVTNSQGEHLPGSVFLRGGSVAMLLILTPSHRTSDPLSSSEEEYAILTIQPRIPAGSLGFIELPAGMLDDSGSFSGAAAKEIEEETGLSVAPDELIDLTKLAVQSRRSTHNETQSLIENDDESHLQNAIYPSPGGSDEFIPIFLVRKSMSLDKIDGLKGKLTGLRDHGEKITLRLCPLRDVWKVACRDGKTLAALALYQGLNAEGKI